MGIENDSSADTSERDPWEGDLLDRKSEGEFLLNFLQGRYLLKKNANEATSFVLNIDAPWGSGKTFFLDRFATQLAIEHQVVRINAWRDDYTDDPLIAVMAELESALFEKVSSEGDAHKNWETAKKNLHPILAASVRAMILHFLTNLGNGAVGAGISAIKEKMEHVTPPNLHDLPSMIDFHSTRGAIDEFKKHLAAALKAIVTDGRSLPVFVLVDELDRCRPTYAISMLERIKHLFDVEGLIFIVATDSTQLAHAIGAVYGNEFDSSKYLHRFFDRRYVLANSDVSSIIRREIAPFDPSNKISLPSGIRFDDFVVGVLNYFRLPARDIIQIVDLLIVCIEAWNRKTPLEIVALLPLIIGWQLGIEPQLSDKFYISLVHHLRDDRDIQSPLLIGFPGGYLSMSDDHVGAEQVPAHELFQCFYNVDTRDLKSLIGHNASRARDYWVEEVFMHEMQTEHGGLSPIGHKQYSLISEYPKLIKMAGRLGRN